MSTDLHQGFANVDGAGSPRSLYDFLELVNSLPEIRSYKRIMRTEMALQPDNTVLDVGCGIGIEACRIARDCPDVKVIGLDREGMIAEARERSESAGFAVRWIPGEAEEIPLPNASVDACMTERVLMYLPDPALAIAEMARVLKPGGRIACFELDYASTMLGGDPDFAARINVSLNAAIAEPRMGRVLPEMLRNAGLIGKTVQPVIFFPPWPVFEATVGNIVRNAVADGELAETQATVWLQSQAEAANAGMFYCAFVGIVASAIRPA